MLFLIINVDQKLFEQTNVYLIFTHNSKIKKNKKNKNKTKTKTKKNCKKTSVIKYDCTSYILLSAEIFQ